LGVETTLTLTTDYTVTLNANQNTNPGGSVTMLTAPATGQSLTITSNVANLQPTAIANLGGFYPEVINDSLDRATIQIQQLDERVDRALVIPVSSSGVSTQLPAPEANRLLGWNNTGTAVTNVRLSTGLGLIDFNATATGTGASQAITVSNVALSSNYQVAVTVDGILQPPTGGFYSVGTDGTNTTVTITATLGSTIYVRSFTAQGLTGPAGTPADMDAYTAWSAPDGELTFWGRTAGFLNRKRALGSNWTSAIGTALPSPWAAYLAKSPDGSGGFYSNHNVLDGGRQDAVVWEFNDRVMMGDAADDDLTAPMIAWFIVSITRSGTTATVTTSANHGFSTSDTIKITGAAQSDYNGTFTITVTGLTTFTYTVANSPATPATTIQAMQAAKVTATTTATESWLETFRRTSVRAAQAVILSKEGQLALTLASRTSDWPFANSESTIGLNVYGLNDNATQVQIAWGIYGEGVRYAGAGTTFAMELDIVNFGTEVTADLHDIHPDYLTVAAWLANGGAYYGAQSATAAIGIVDNGATWINGIICEATALDGCNGAGTGAASFMRIACGHRLDWEYASNTLGSRIWSAVTSATTALAQKFTNTGFELTSLDDATQYYQLGMAYLKTRSGTGVWIGSGMGSVSQTPTYIGALRMFDNGGLAGGGGLEFHNPFFGSGYGYRLIAPDLGGGSTPLIFQRRANSASWSQGMILTASGGLVVPKTSGDPTATEDGEIVYNTSTNKFRGRVSGSWVDLH
jgi:hypothetical protein